MLGFEEDRTEFDVHFNNKDYRVSRERIDIGEEAYERISIFDSEGLVLGLEYTKDDFEDFEMLSQRDNNEVEAYERTSSGFKQISLDEFREVYNNLNGGQEDFQTDYDFKGSEIAETFKNR